jgi:hypothetical protein
MKKIVMSFMCLGQMFFVGASIDQTLSQFAGSLNQLSQALGGSTLSVDDIKQELDVIIDKFNQGQLTYEMFDDFEDLNTDLYRSSADTTYYDAWEDRLWLEYFFKNYASLSPDKLFNKIKQDSQNKDFLFFVDGNNVVGSLSELQNFLKSKIDNNAMKIPDIKGIYSDYPQKVKELVVHLAEYELIDSILSGVQAGVKITPAEANVYKATVKGLKNVYPDLMQGYESKISKVDQSVVSN